MHGPALHLSCGAIYCGDVGASYLPYLEANAAAFKAGETRFDHRVDGYEYPGMRVSVYRVWCLERLRQALFALSHNKQEAVKTVLDDTGGWRALTSHQDVKSNYDPEGPGAICQAGSGVKVHSAGLYAQWLELHHAPKGMGKGLGCLAGAKLSRQ